MSNTPQVDLSALHTNITNAIKAQFPDLKDAGAYPRPGDMVKTPAVYFELDAIEVTAPMDVGTEQVRCALTFNAYCVVSYKGTAKLAARLLAASVMSWLRGKRFGQPVGIAQPMSADPDTFAGDAAGEYECMRVMWRHEPVYLGTSTWDATGVMPTEVWLGIDPETGAANLSKYIKLAPPAP